MANGDNDINICSRALNAIGANSITSFEEGTTEAAVAANKYQTAKKDLLSIYRWTFNQCDSYLAELNTDQLSVYKHLYEVPEDCLRVIALRENGNNVDYTFRLGKINTNANKPIVTYCSDVSEAAMPPYFITVLIDRLARDFLIPVTGNESQYRTFDNIYQQSLAFAKNIDAQSKPASRIKNFGYIGVR